MVTTMTECALFAQSYIIQLFSSFVYPFNNFMFSPRRNHTYEIRFGMAYVIASNFLTFFASVSRKSAKYNQKVCNVIKGKNKVSFQQKNASAVENTAEAFGRRIKRKLYPFGHNGLGYRLGFGGFALGINFRSGFGRFLGSRFGLLLLILCQMGFALGDFVLG